MKTKKLLKSAHTLSEHFRIDHPGRFRLSHVNPAETLWFNQEDRPRIREALEEGIELMAELQDKLYAYDKWAVLLIFQAMDAAGKDSAIKHVMSGLNPQGCQVFSFKTPSAGELDHDYLWRCSQKLPNRGHIGIFNRSYYEETLVVRVHPEFLKNQKLPPELLGKKLWKHRFEDIRNFEKYLTRNGIIVRKFFLHVSKEEQKKRFLERIDRPEKNWKFSASDLSERERWTDYQRAYEDTIRCTSTREAPWYVVPADHKWFTRLVVASAVVDTLASLDMHYPRLEKRQLAALKEARRRLTRE